MIQWKKKLNNQSKGVLLKRNFLMNAILMMSSFIFPLIAFPYASRILLSVGIGKVSFATLIVSYFSMFAQLGIPTYGIRACAKVRDNHEELTCTVQELFIINAAMSTLAYAVFFTALFMVLRLDQDKELFLIVSPTIFFNVTGTERLYKAPEQYTYITARSIIFKFIAPIVMFLLIHVQSDYVLYGGISVFAASASNVLNLCHAHKYVGFKLVGNYNFKRYLKTAIVLFAVSCATTVYTHLDAVMLDFTKTNVDIGYYNAAVKIRSIMVSIMTSLGTALLPRPSYYVEHNMMDGFGRTIKKAIHFVFLVALPLMLFLISPAKEGVYFLSGNVHEGSILPMQPITPTLLLTGLANIMDTQVLVPLGKEKAVLYLEVAGVVADVIINVLLIPSMASAGTVIETPAAEWAVWVVQYTVLRSLVRGVYRRIKHFHFILALVCGSFCSLLVKKMVFGSFISLRISAILFPGVYGFILTIFKEPLILEMEKQIFGKLIKKTKDRIRDMVAREVQKG